MPATPFFRDVVLPSHEQDRRAHERFLLDAHAQRRAEARKPALRRLVAALRAAVA